MLPLPRSLPGGAGGLPLAEAAGIPNPNEAATSPATRISLRILIAPLNPLLLPRPLPPNPPAGPKTGIDATHRLKTELRDHVGAHIGAIAKPDEVRFAEALPKTRSGKIMRRLLKEIASGARVTGDTTTLEDFSVLARLSESEE